VHAGAIPSDGRAEDREIWSLAWPVILSQILASIISLVDIAMLGRLGPQVLAGVGYVTQFFWLAQAALMAVGIAGVALISRALGARDPAGARAAFAATVGVSQAVAVVVAALILAEPATLLRWLNAEPAVIEVALPYLRLTLASTLIFSVSIAYESGFRAAKDTRTPLGVAAVLAVVKIVLNWLLIFGPFGLPTLGLVGAGLATLCAQAVGAIALVAASRHGPLALRRSDWRRAPGELGELLGIAWPAIAERVLLNLAIMSYFAVLGSYGSAAVAAYTVGARILSFSWIPGIGFSAASATLVGHAIGAREPAAARRAGWRSARFAFLVSVVLGIGFAVFRQPLAQIFSDDAAVLQGLDSFMLVLALAQPLLGVHFTLGGALRGAGYTVSPLLAAAVGNWVLRVPLAFAFGKWLELDVVWLWFALVADHALRAVWMVGSFRAGRWLPAELRSESPAPSIRAPALHR